MDSLEELAEERDRLRTEETGVLAEIGKTRSKLEKLRTELQTLRKTRDELNETVKGLKKTRDEQRELARRSLDGLRRLGKAARGEMTYSGPRRKWPSWNGKSRRTL